MKSPNRHIVLFSLLLLILVILFVLDILFGTVTLSPSQVFSSVFSNADGYTETIVTQFRIPKAITAMLVGTALSVSGLQMQTVFRNPMAGPYVLGISSGASLGVAIIILGFSSIFTAGSIGTAGSWALAIAAWAGSGAVLMLMMMISARVKEIMTVLIIGIMLSSGISAIVTIMQYFSNETMLKSFVIWTMGSLGNLTTEQLKVLTICISAGIILSVFSTKMLNALLLGDNYASSMGLRVRYARTLVFLCTSILAGSVTAFCGPIGFIGIAVPHIARMLFRTSDHRILIPGTVLAGGAIMLASDIISQLPGSGHVLPVNAVASFIGVPVVIWIIMRNRKYSGVY